MGPFLKKFFTDETAFVRMSRALIGGFGVGGAAFADQIAANVTPGHAHIVKIVCSIMVLFSFMLGAGEKNADPVHPAVPAPLPTTTLPPVAAVVPLLALSLLLSGCLTMSAEEVKLKSAIAATPSCASVTVGSELDELVSLAITLAPQLMTENVAEIMDTAIAAHKNVDVQCLLAVVEYMIGQPTIAPPSLPNATALASALTMKGPAKVNEALLGISAYRQHVQLTHK